MLFVITNHAPKLWHEHSDFAINVNTVVITLIIIIMMMYLVILILIPFYWPCWVFVDLSCSILCDKSARLLLVYYKINPGFLRIIVGSISIYRYCSYVHILRQRLFVIGEVCTVCTVDAAPVEIRFICWWYMCEYMYCINKPRFVLDNKLNLSANLLLLWQSL